MDGASFFGRTEGAVQTAVEWLRLAIESLGALVIIRTALNYFLMLEMRSETRAERRPIVAQAAAEGG